MTRHCIIPHQLQILSPSVYHFPQNSTVRMPVQDCSSFPQGVGCGACTTVSDMTCRRGLRHCRHEHSPRPRRNPWKKWSDSQVPVGRCSDGVIVNHDTRNGSERCVQYNVGECDTVTMEGDLRQRTNLEKLPSTLLDNGRPEKYQDNQPHYEHRSHKQHQFPSTSSPKSIALCHNSKHQTFDFNRKEEEKWLPPLQEPGYHVTLMTLPNFRMSLALISVILAALSITPVTGTSVVTRGGGVRDSQTVNRFAAPVTPPSGSTASSRGYWKEIPGNGAIKPLSHMSTGNGGNKNNLEGGRNRRGGRAPDTSTERVGASSKKSTFVGVPVVRAHSTGFISLVDDPSGGSSGGVGSDLMMTPKLAEESTKVLKFGSCLCWNTTDDGQKREVECKCTGQEMTNVVSSLPSDIHRLTVEHAANFTTMGNDDLRPYGSSLTELVISELPRFETLKNGTFVGMRNLNTIYIHGAPALTQISDVVFNVYLPELKTIRISHTSLEVVPNLSQLHIKPGAALHAVDFENNKVARLVPGSFKGLMTEDLALSYNNLEQIGPFAFNGSTIARLTLKGNPLKVLHSESFVGIHSLRVLDLSETQITYLPTANLAGLEVLRLEKVWTLSVIPSIYHFQLLERAYLTWPYHCCAFEFPETHDPDASQRYKEFVRSVLELCVKNNSTTNSTDDSEDAKDDSGGGNTADSKSVSKEFHASSDSQRQKRQLRMSELPDSLRITSARHWKRMYVSTQNMSSVDDAILWINDDSPVNPAVIYEKDEKNDKILSHRLISRLMVTTSGGFDDDGRSNPNVGTSPHLRKLAANGRHRRQAAQRKSGSSAKDELREKSGSSRPGSKDEFHTHHGSGNGDNNPVRHPFDSDDGSVLHYGKISPEAQYNPFAFDPDQSFDSILDPHDFERESDIVGKDRWESFSHSHEASFGGDEHGTFLSESVTPSPTVISLCGNVAVKKPPKVTCRPLPDAFNPCEDIMGSIWLRGAVWVVVALALVGNTAVLVVLLLAPGRISVQRFLMANLSWADLCMGIYLLMVATQDLVSLGSYFNYAIDWQLGWGCQIAGFLTVFASELSVFTLAVITGERWYALTRAIHLTKRLTLLGAAQLMAFGWFMACMLAALPLMGVSSYSKTSICLPMEASSGGAVAYLVFLLLFNGVAFLLVACAYWQMYRAVAGHGRSGTGAAPAASSADTAIAKKMALLVFTDFACWAPVAFFGLTAVGGMPLIGVTDSKILLVFFYPLNACCNPYLYAILTKQYRRDLLLLLSRHGICTKRAARYKTGAASTNHTMQTMQTVLRMGSMTETKVAGSSSGGGRGGLLNGGRSSIAATSATALDSPLENDRLLLPSGGEGGSSHHHDKLLKELTTAALVSKNEFNHSQQGNYHPNILDHPLKPNHPSHRNGTADDVRKALNLHPADNDDDDVFDLNGLSGRHIAETSFISVPLTTGSGGSGMRNGVEKVGESASHGRLDNGIDPAREKLLTQKDEDHNRHKTSPVLRGDKINNFPILSKDESELDPEISETTPFCTVRD